MSTEGGWGSLMNEQERRRGVKINIVKRAEDMEETVEMLAVE